MTVPIRSLRRGLYALTAATNRGGMLRLSAPMQGGSMVTWTPNHDGTVRQHWERSSDGGTTWATAFDGRYVRQP